MKLISICLGALLCGCGGEVGGLTTSLTATQDLGDIVLWRLLVAETTTKDGLPLNCDKLMGEGREGPDSWFLNVLEDKEVLAGGGGTEVVLTLAPDQEMTLLVFVEGFGEDPQSPVAQGCAQDVTLRLGQENHASVNISRIAEE